MAGGTKPVLNGCKDNQLLYSGSKVDVMILNRDKL